MSVKAVLFDLDGTLLPLDQDKFINEYLTLLAKKLAQHGYQPQKLIEAIWAGTGEMIKHRDDLPNEASFWKKFKEIFGEESEKDIPLFEEYYRTDFQKVRDICGYDKNAVLTVKHVKEKGLRAVLATNPLFPAIATESRMSWAGFSKEDFELYTTYENSTRTKPNPEYYLEITSKLGLDPHDCLMVGNDASEDLIAETVGMKVFLLTDNLINSKNIDISKYRRGGFPELIEYIDELTAEA